jgi:hypothetical protein
MQLDTTKAILYLHRSEKKILTLTIHKYAVSFVKGTVSQVTGFSLRTDGDFLIF